MQSRPYRVTKSLDLANMGSKYVREVGKYRAEHRDAAKMDQTLVADFGLDALLDTAFDLGVEASRRQHTLQLEQIEERLARVVALYDQERSKPWWCKLFWR